MPLVNIDITMPEGKIAEVTAMLDGVKNGSQQVISRAINKVGTAARTQIVRRIVQEVNLKAGEVRDRNVSLSKASYSRLEAMIRISGRRIPLLRWGARQTAKGVSYAIQRGGGRKTVPGAFMEGRGGGKPVAMPSGHRGVFVKTGAPRPGRGSKLLSGLTGLGERRRMGLIWSRMKGPWMVQPRLPISERYGPSVPAVMEGVAELSAEMLDAQYAAKLETEIDSQIGLVLERRGLGSSS